MKQASARTHFRSFLSPVLVLNCHAMTVFPQVLSPFWPMLPLTALFAAWICDLHSWPGNLKMSHHMVTLIIFCLKSQMIEIFLENSNDWNYFNHLSCSYNFFLDKHTCAVEITLICHVGDPRWIPCGNAEVESAFCLTEVAGALESFRSKNENEDKVQVC